MKRKDFYTLQSVYSILGMQLSRRGKLYIAGKLAKNTKDCIYQTLKTENESLIQDANLVYNNFIEMEKEENEQ